MAKNYKTNELYASASVDPFPRIVPEHAYPKTIGAAVGAPELAVGTPMGFDSAAEEWIVWSASGSSGSDAIKGFIYQRAVQTDATQQVQGIIMVAGEIHAEDVVLPSGESQANLDAALKSGPRALGLFITGLVDVR